METSVWARNKQLVVTLALTGMLVGGGHLPEHVESLVFYVVVFGVALLGYGRNRALNLLLGCSTVLFLVAWRRAFEDVVFNVLFTVSGLICLAYGIKSTIAFALRAHRVSGNEVFALVNCYLLAGYMWALLYTLVESLLPGSFSIQATPEHGFDAFIYFSFITMSTVGYGDTVPRSILAQRLCVLQAVAAQFYFALVVAYLINKLFQQREEERSRDLAGRG